MPSEWLFTWWNAVYSLPLAFVLLFLVITSVVGLAGGAIEELGSAQSEAGEVDAVDGHLHHDADADGHGDLAHAGAHPGGGAAPLIDGGLETDLDRDGDIDAVDRAIHMAHAGHAANPGLLVSTLVLLGVGRAPLMLVLQTLLLSWGLIGLALHHWGGAAGPGALLWSMPLTLLLSVIGTRIFAGLFGRIYRPFETAAVKRHQIVGRTGRVVYPVTEEEGTVHVRDGHGTLHRVRARSRHGSLDSGREIIILGYDPEQKVYQVDDASAFVDRP